MNLAKEDSCTGKEAILNSVYSLKHGFIACVKKKFSVCCLCGSDIFACTAPMPFTGNCFHQ